MRAIQGLALTLFAVLSLVSGTAARAEEWSDGATSGSKSATIATLVSVIGTAVPVAAGIHDWNKTDGDHGAPMILGGYLLGPALGHFYAGRPNAAFGGMALRLVPIVLLGGAVSASWDAPSKAADVLAVGSALLATGIVAWDIGRTSNSVHAYNEDHAHPRVSLGVVPASRELTPAIRIDVPM
jgi:ABC-type nickel/cobalt efflux system permease component RcnA